MTKAEKIRMRIDVGMTNAQIVAETGFSPDYVRAVRGRYLRPWVERAWLKTDAGRAYNRRQQRRWYHNHPEQAREYARKRYREKNKLESAQ